MLIFIAKRLISGVILLLVVSVATFFLAHAAIGDPTVGLLGSSATAAQQEALAAQIGTDRPLLVQFADWFGRLLAFDLGDSWRNFQPVADQVFLRLPVTLSVVTFAIVLTAVFGAMFGVLAGLRPGTWIDKSVKGAAVVLFALPGFWVSLVLVIWFAVQLKWFPAVGYVAPATSLDGWLRSITLPAVSLALGAIVMVAEQLRNAIIAVNGLDFVRTLRSRGLSEPRVITHLLRASAPPALTVLAVMFVALLSGAVVVESIFSLSGIGTLTLGSSQNGDIPMLLGVTVIAVVFVVLVNLVLDIVLGWINPKVRVA